MSTTVATSPAVVKYAPGDVVRVKDYKERVTITGVIDTATNIGYSGVYTAHYRGSPVEMTLGWIPQGLIEQHVVSPSWR